MPMGWVAAGTAAAGLIGSYMSSSAASDAADSQAQSAANAAAQQQAQYQQSRSDELPWMNLGQGAANQLSRLYGLNGQAPDYSAVENSPNYQFAFNQGQQALDKSAAARGNLYAGGYGKDLVNYGQGMASQQLNNYAAQLMQVSGQGQNAASGTGVLGQQATAYAGDARYAGASAYGGGQISQANAWNQGLNQLGQAGTSYLGYQQSFNNPNSANYIPPVNAGQYPIDQSSWTPTY
jgi:hypothetical protein